MQPELRSPTVEQSCTRVIAFGAMSSFCSIISDSETLIQDDSISSSDVPPFQNVLNDIYRSICQFWAKAAVTRGFIDFFPYKETWWPGALYTYVHEECYTTLYIHTHEQVYHYFIDIHIRTPCRFFSGWLEHWCSCIIYVIFQKQVRVFDKEFQTQRTMKARGCFNKGMYAN